MQRLVTYFGNRVQVMRLMNCVHIFARSAKRIEEGFVEAISVWLEP